MAHIKVPPGQPGIRALFAFRPEPAAAIAELTNILLHGPNSLPPGDRELIAAYVSALNDCEYCRESHIAIAACHFDDEPFVRSVVADPETAAIPLKLKALLALARQVQRGGRMVGASDIVRARTCGATDVEIHDTVLIAAAFCMFNRYVDGLDAGDSGDPEARRQRARLVARHGYSVALPQPASSTERA